MSPDIAQSVARHLRKSLRSHTAGPVIREAPRKSGDRTGFRYLINFNQHADFRPCKGAFLVQHGKTRFWVLVVQWRHPELDDFYLVVMDEKHDNLPILEVRHTDDAGNFNWRYRATKQDRRNAERVELFANLHGSRDVTIRPPETPDDVANFIAELADARLKRIVADSLDRSEVVSAPAGQQQSTVGHGRRLSLEERLAIERYAMKLAKQYLEKHGWEWEDKSRSESFDYIARKGKRRVIVEVKGTTGTSDQFEITHGEVNAHRANHPHNMLIVVHSISLQRQGRRIVASKGRLRVEQQWKIEDHFLKPISYVYSFRKTSGKPSVLQPRRSRKVGTRGRSAGGMG